MKTRVRQNNYSRANKTEITYTEERLLLAILGTKVLAILTPKSWQQKNPHMATDKSFLP